MFKEQRLVVVGSRKMVVRDDVGKSLLLYDQRVNMSPDGVSVTLTGAGGVEL